MTYDRTDAREHARNVLAARLAAVRGEIRSHEARRRAEAELTAEIEALERETADRRPRPPTRLPIAAKVSSASPCKERWEGMVGDERVRRCSRCDRDVYDLGGMSADEITALIAQRGGELRFFERADGTMITSDCPVGRPRRIALRLLAAAGLAFAALAVAGVLSVVVATPPSPAVPRTTTLREPVFTWARTTPMPEARDSVLSVAHAGHLYMIGGIDEHGVVRDDVFIGSIGPSGDILEWVASPTPFPTPIHSAPLVADDGYLYTLGGETGTAQLDEVWMARIAPDGSLGAWSRTTSFHGIRGGALGAALNGYLYVIGGRFDPQGGGHFCSAHTDVQFAHRNPDGTLGPWRATASIERRRWWSYNIAVARDRLYLMGGYTGCGGYESQVVFATPAPDGSLREWTETTTMARAGANFSAVYGDLMLTIGGDPGGHPTGRVDIARIADDGALGAWQPGPTVPEPYTGSTAGASYGGFIYQVATIRGGSAVPDILVMRASEGVDASPR